MGKFCYVTNRTLDSKAGVNEAGRAKIFVLTGTNTLEGDYRCPECGHEGKINQEFKRPISFRCEKCEFLIKLPKLKGKKKKK